MKKLILIILIFAGCSQVREVGSPTQRQPETTKTTPPKPNRVSTNKAPLSGYKISHAFKNKNRATTEKIYVKPFNDSIFTSLFITTSLNNLADTLYSIQKNQFRNKKGMDIEVAGEALKGYKFVAKNDRYITVVCVDKNLQESSDYITIQKDPLSNLFTVVPTP